MIVLKTVLGDQTYDEEEDSWTGSMADELNQRFRLRVLDIPASEPSMLHALRDELLEAYPGSEFDVPDREPGDPGDIY